VPPDHRFDLAPGHQRVHDRRNARGRPCRVDDSEAHRAAEYAADGVDLLGRELRAQFGRGAVDAGRAVQWYQ